MRGMSDMQRRILATEDVTVEEGRQPAAENGDRQADEDLVDAQRDVRMAKSEAEDGAGGHAGGDAPARALPSDTQTWKPKKAPASIMPFDAEVEQPGLLADRLAERGEDQRDGGHQTRRQHGRDEGDEGDAAQTVMADLQRRSPAARGPSP